MRQEIEISNFTAGELSPRLKGRIDLTKYFSGLDTALNMVIMPQGGATRRPGTLYVSNAKDQSNPARMVRFVFSTVQAYELEFSHLNVRVYMNHGVVLNGGVPVDIVVPYTAADLKTLKFTQSADTLFITHPSYPPATLTRSSHIAWTYSTTSFRDGPYLPINLTDTTLTPSGNTGSITLTASSVTGINNDQGFLASDVGRCLRIRLYSLWAWVVITAWTSTTVVTATVQAKVNNGATNALDGVAWASATLYAVGTVVSNHGLYFRCSQAGKSGPTNGPNGTGSNIPDGSCVWARISAFNATRFRQNATYNNGDVVVNAGGQFYFCTQGGASNGSSIDPAGTGINVSTSGVPPDGLLWDFIQPIAFPTATKDWRLGRWGSAQGYPFAVRFWQQRLFFSGYVSQPNAVIGSATADFTNMAPSLADGTVSATNAVDWEIDDDQVNTINAMVAAGSAQSMQLGLLTSSGENILQAATSAQALTPTSVQAYAETSYGSAANVDPLRIGKAVLFADRPGRKLREWSFFWQSNGYVGPDLTQLSEHITRAGQGADPSLSGIAQMVYCAAPHQVIWAIRNDGQLISFTYDREQTVFAPAQHRLGGSYYGGPPIVESLSTIPSPDGSYDELWLAVLRTINGVPKRFIEVMTAYFDGLPPDNAFFVDAGLPSALTFPAATLTPSGLTNVAVVTDPPAYKGTGTFTANTGVIFSPASVGSILRLNGGKVVVQSYISPTQVTGLVLQRLLNLSPAAQNSWSITPLSTSFSGLSHLNGESVAILGDGAVFDPKIVSAGAVAIPSPGASFATIGLSYLPALVGMPWEPVRAAAVASQGKIKRADTLWLFFHETLGGAFGMRTTDSMTGQVVEDLEPIQSRSAADPMNNAPPLFSGSRKVKPRGGYDEQGQVVVTQPDPLPMTVLSIRAGGDVEEMSGG